MVGDLMGVTMVKIYDTETEYKMAEEIRQLKRQRDKCERTLVFMFIVLVLIMIVVGMS